jgi:hypothetical protein
VDRGDKALQWQFFADAFFHLSTWVVFAERLPGAVGCAALANSGETLLMDRRWTASE